jgi:hypothetical protein
MKAAGKEMKGFMKSNDLKIENIEKLHDDMSDMLVRCFPVIHANQPQFVTCRNSWTVLWLISCSTAC